MAQAGWWVDIIVAAKGGFWHVLEVGSVYPERIILDGACADPSDDGRASRLSRTVTRQGVTRLGASSSVGRAVPPPARPTSRPSNPTGAATLPT